MTGPADVRPEGPPRDGYAPWPEQELRDLVLYAMPAVSHVAKDALASFAALRERALIAEMENGQLQRRIAELTRASSPRTGEQEP